MEIIERFAHAHHDDVGDEAIPLHRQPVALRALHTQPISQAVACDHDLADDLTRGEIAHEALRAGVAERTIERAADLTRQTERAAIGFRDVDALHLVRTLACVFAGKTKEPLARAVV